MRTLKEPPLQAIEQSWARIRKWLEALPAWPVYLCAIGLVLWMGVPRVGQSSTSALANEQRWEDVDTKLIYQEAQAATREDMLRWWTGSWIQEEQPFYRPLTSHLFYAEYLLFGRDYGSYCWVTTAFHAVNTLLLFCLAMQLLRGPPRARAALGVLAVVGFAGAWGDRQVIGYVLTHWAPQTDVVSLTCGLLSLNLLTPYLRNGGRARLGAALALFMAGLLVKEMAVVTAVGACLLSLHFPERRRQVWLGYGALTLVFLILRWRFLPMMNYDFSGWLDFRKAALLIARPLPYSTEGALLWPGIAALAVLASFVWLRRRQPTRLLLAPAISILSAVLACWALAERDVAVAIYLTVQGFPEIARVMLFLTGVWALLTRLREWPFAALVLVFLAAAWIILPYPIGAPHYRYWPGALWGLLQAALFVPMLQTAWSWLRGGTGADPSAQAA